jgi:hypothetical protein
VARTFDCPAPYCEPTDWSGETLLVNTVEEQAWDVWTVSTSDGAASPLLAEAFGERDARFSPDGGWIAYVSDESGKAEVSVRAVAGPPIRIVVSGGGGAQPVWRRDGAELFFVEPDGQLQSVSVKWTAEGAPKFEPHPRPNVPPIGFGHWGTQYDVSPDGSRIYSLRRNEDPPPREIRVVIGCRSALEVVRPAVQTGLSGSLPRRRSNVANTVAPSTDSCQSRADARWTPRRPRYRPARVRPRPPARQH